MMISITITSTDQVYVGAQHVGRVRMTRTGLVAYRLSDGKRLDVGPCSLAQDKPASGVRGRASTMALLQFFFTAAP
jgi:hypothetical protein